MKHFVLFCFIHTLAAMIAMATPAMMKLSGGGTHAVNRTDGDRIIVTWGEAAAKNGALAEVIADLAGNTACRVRWEDPAGTTYDINCQAEAAGHRMSARGDLFLPFSVTFF